MNIEWPVFMFEVDGYFRRVDSQVNLCHLYEPEYWDEVSVVFDAEFKRLEIRDYRAHPRLEVVAGVDVVSFEKWARKALIRMWKVNRFRVRRANIGEAHWVENLDARALWRELIIRSEL